MKILLACILVVLVILAALRKKAPQPITAAMYALLALFIVVQGMILVRGCSSPGSMYIPSFNEVAGKTLGAMIAEAAPGAGTVVVLLQAAQGPDGAGLSEIQQAQLAGLRTAFQETLLTVVEIQVQPAMEGLMGLVAAGPSITEQQFYGLLQQEPDAVAAISCIGMPPLASELRSDVPPLYFLEVLHEPEGRHLVEQGLAAGGVFLRSGADWTQKPKRGMSDEEVFQLRYVRVTPEDV